MEQAMAAVQVNQSHSIKPVLPRIKPVLHRIMPVLHHIWTVSHRILVFFDGRLDVNLNPKPSTPNSRFSRPQAGGDKDTKVREDLFLKILGTKRKLMREMHAECACLKLFDD